MLMLLLRKLSEEKNGNRFQTRIKEGWKSEKEGEKRGREG